MSNMPRLEIYSHSVFPSKSRHFIKTREILPKSWEYNGESFQSG